MQIALHSDSPRIDTLPGGDLFSLPLNAKLPGLSSSAAFQDLLVAYDSSPSADVALQYASALARRWQGRLHLVFVGARAEETGYEPRVADHLQQEAARKLHRIRHHLSEGGVKVDVTQATGDVTRELISAAARQKPDLVVMGAFGFGSTERTGLGSSAESLLRSVDCPVLMVGPHVVCRPPSASSESVLLCVLEPGAASNQEVLSTAVRLAAALDAHIRLLLVAGPPAEPGDHHAFEAQCEMISESIRKQGVSVRWTLMYGCLPAIVRPHTRTASMALISSRRSRPDADSRNELLLETIRDSACPVIVIPG